MTSKPDTPLLDKVKSPADLRLLDESELKQLAEELRAETIDAVSITGGHLGAGLGVVELTVALHYVFNTPEDKLIWDVGHQCYPHQDPDGTPRPHSHASPGRWPVRLHKTRRKRL